MDWLAVSKILQQAFSLRRLSFLFVLVLMGRWLGIWRQGRLPGLLGIEFLIRIL